MISDHVSTAIDADQQRLKWRAPVFAAVTACMATLVIVIGAQQTLPRPLNPVEAAIAASWAAPPAHTRLWAQQDITQRECTHYGNRPPDREAVAIMEREWRAIVYPADGVVFGDWQRGAVLARHTGATGPGSDAGPAISGQCAACHQLEPGFAPASKVAHIVMPDTSGPALTGYGRKRSFAASEAKLLYEQIFSSNAVIACSVMPRFGAQKVLSPEQIRDIVAFLLSPESPVNAEPGGNRVPVSVRISPFADRR